MNTHHGEETADAHLLAQMRHPGTPWTVRPEGPFVTLSRESGADGSSLARASYVRTHFNADFKAPSPTI